MLSLSHTGFQTDKSVSIYVSENEASLFFKVPKHILSFIDGCPSRVTKVEISYDEETERAIFCTTDKKSEKPRFTIAVSIEKILKLVEIEGIRRNEEALFAILGRQAIILRALSFYIKKNVQIMIYDPLLFEE